MLAKHAQPGGPSEAEEWFTGPWGNLLHLRRLEKVMLDIARTGRPEPPGKPKLLSNGQVAVDVFPGDRRDRLFFKDVEAELRMHLDVRPEDVTHLWLTVRKKQWSVLLSTLGPGHY